MFFEQFIFSLYKLGIISEELYKSEKAACDAGDKAAEKERQDFEYWRRSLPKRQKVFPNDETSTRYRNRLREQSDAWERGYAEAGGKVLSG